MASKMDIINLALVNLSREPVESIADTRPGSANLGLAWDIALCGILRDHPWRFATRRKKLAELTEQPIGFAYAYVYPEDCISARRVVHAAGAMQTPSPFEVGRSLDGRHKAILTDLPNAALEYTSNRIPCEEFDPQFVCALSWGVAAEISLSLHSDPHAHQAAVSTYAATLLIAKAMDTREGVQPVSGDFLFGGKQA